MNSVFRKEYSPSILMEKYLEMDIQTKHIVELIEKMGEEFFVMINENNNHLWFKAIEYGRCDALEIFISYGIQDYTEYRTDTGLNSFGYLICWYSLGHIETIDFVKIFHLFCASGIPTDNVRVHDDKPSMFSLLKETVYTSGRYRYSFPLQRDYNNFSLLRFLENFSPQESYSVLRRYARSIFDCFPVEFEEVGITI